MTRTGRPVASVNGPVSVMWPSRIVSGAASARAAVKASAAVSLATQPSAWTPTQYVAASARAASAIHTTSPTNGSRPLTRPRLTPDVERGPCEPDVLAADARELVGERAAVGQVQPGVELEQGHQHEAPAAYLAVRDAQALGLVRLVAQEQHVDVDRPRPVADAAGRPAQQRLDRLAGVEQRLRLQAGLDPHRRVEERRLVEHLADRLGLVDRGGGEHLDAAAPQVLDGGLEHGAAVAHVGAQAEVAELARTHRGSRIIASWRDWATSVPSCAHSSPSSSHAPPADTSER